MPTTFVRLASLLALLTVAACGTVAGAGRDISTAGDAITEQSNDTASQ